MDKVYIVTSGSYSDYEIRAVFLDKGIAEQYAKIKQDATVDEWPLSDGRIFAKQFYFKCAYNTKDATIGDAHFSKGRYEYDVSQYDDDETDREDKSSYDLQYGYISLERPLAVSVKPSEALKEMLRAKYLKVCQDMAAEIEAREKGIG